MGKEIEVGDYVRTTNGSIGKCVLKESETPRKYNYCVLTPGVMLSVSGKEVKKHSKNVLELLERGDIFVTASGCIHKVEDIRNGTIWDIGFGVSQETTRVITAIMTKEQFEKISYKVGEGTWNS